MATAIPKSEAVTIVEESAFTAGARVDRERGIIQGVKILGSESRNGRVYPASVIRSSVPLYEGAKVNVNHPQRDPLQPRTYEDRLGQVRNVRVREDGLYGDFHFNPKHRLAEQLAWDAEHNPDVLGFSHNATVRFAAHPNRGRRVVEEIIGVRSVDLVADPATTRSLFESEQPQMDPSTDPAPATVSSSDPLEMIVDSIAAKIGEIAKAEGDPKGKIKQIADLLKKQDKIMGLLGDKPAESGGDATGGDTSTQEHVSLKAQIDKLTQQLEQYQLRDQQQQLEQAIEGELREAGLEQSNPLHVSETFVEQLLACESKGEREKLIKDRAALVKTIPRVGKPHSSMSSATEAVGELSASEMVRRWRR